MSGFVAKAVRFAGGGIGSLGFASTAGAFIGGAAKQLNQNLEEEQAQERQDDVLQQAYTARADRGIQDYKSLQNQYNSALQLSGGNKQIAEAAMGMLPKNAKPADIITAINAAGASVKSDPNFQPSFMQNKRSDMDFLVGRLKPKYKNMLQVPDDNSQTSSQQPQPSPFTSDQQPDRLTADQSANATPVSGAQPVPLDNSQGSPGVSSDNGQSFTPNTQVAGNNTTPNSNGFTPIPGVEKPMTAAQKEALRLHSESNDLARDKFNLDRDRKPTSPEEAADIKVRTEDAEKYLHDPKTGIQARRAEFGSYISQQYDFNTLQDALNRGFKASSVQDTYDQLNRFTSSMFGVNLSQMGVSNTVQDTNTLRKAVANGIIQRLSTLHFGRITNAEMGMVERGFTNPTTDPSTNIKIILTLKSLVSMGAEQTDAAWQSIYGKNATGKYMIDRVQQARLAEDEVLQKYESQRVPWAQIDNGPDAAKQWAAIPNGTWVENRSAGSTGGMMYYKDNNGKMKAAGDPIQ